jgi:hypothetical protein
LPLLIKDDKDVNLMIDMLESTPQVKDAGLYINGEPLIEHGGEELQ